MDLIQSLKNIGFNEKEAKVYLALLQTGKSTAYTISKVSQLKKSTTYVILEELIDKGAVAKIPREKVLQYVATSPEDLFAMAQSRLQTAQESLSELQALNKRKKYEVSVAYYEGVTGIREMYYKSIKLFKNKNKPMMAFFSHERDTPPELSALWPEINDAWRRNKVKIKGLTVYDQSIKDFIKKIPPAKYLMDLKLLDPKRYDSNISIEIFDKFVQIISHRYIQGIVIYNPDIADVLRQIFELVWERQDLVKQEVK